MRACYIKKVVFKKTSGQYLLAGYILLLSEQQHKQYFAI